MGNTYIVRKGSQTELNPLMYPATKPITAAKAPHITEKPNIISILWIIGVSFFFGL